MTRSQIMLPSVCPLLFLPHDTNVCMSSDTSPLTRDAAHKK
jgi:hypothetical protein